ncbi:MAG TPA: twin-arginine translocation signal domain-containing protein [Pirellulales bacterium]|nr:twin-arginine translocation signal domain-containing protein [Pirellulales bacterium]
MTTPAFGPTSRREFVKFTGRAAAATALLGVTIPKVHAAEDNTIQIALVGCGGRGTGAAADALRVKNGPIKLVAMADVFPSKLNESYGNLSSQFKDQVDVPAERQFIGFDAYRNAIDCLRPSDVVLFTTPPAFRWVHFAYAIEKGINVFMEKPTTVDGPSTRKMLLLAEESMKKNLKVGVGLMCRHCEARGELFQRIKGGEMGDILMLRAYRMHGPVGTCFVEPPKGDMTELLYQVRNFHGFLWASGGCYSDFMIHNIDESCWMKDSWPVEARGSGGRHFRGDFVDQNFDSYSVEYTFSDGAKLFLEGRYIAGCQDKFASYAHGTKGVGVISTSGHAPAKSRIYQGQNFDDNKLVWQFDRDEPNPYQLEWDHLIAAVRSDSPYNEAKRGAEASLVTSMGRMACHTGQVVTFDQMLNCEHEFAPDVDKLTMDSHAPVLRNANGKYPVPLPGLLEGAEYQV